ncbi:MAG: phosphotransferase [Candidatus Sungbacteria bacterium]|nr:phosphotransferase [Candidatus Sungbacteria bacterium]
MNKQLEYQDTYSKTDGIRSVLKEFQIGRVLTAERYGHGIINETYLVRVTPHDGAVEQRFIAQRLHTIFRPTVLEDMAAVTEHLAGKGITTPRLMRSRTGAFGVMRGERCWRLMTYIPGVSYDKGLKGVQLEDAAEFLGIFHNALQDIEYTFVHLIPGFHDTPRIMEKLRETAKHFQKSPHAAVLMPLAERIQRDWAMVVVTLPVLPRRVIHGDLKINNIRFAEDGRRAAALLDLDTMGRNTILVDLGDAIRSWCNPADEDDPSDAYLDEKLFGRFLRGYTRTAGFLTREERESIPAGVEMIILELAARFVTDAFEKKYFKLDDARYPNLYEQNLTKARAQLTLLDDVRGKHAALSMAVAT